MGRAARVFLALLVAGIWITLFCTAPNQLGTWLWGRLGFGTALPLHQLTRVSLIAIAIGLAYSVARDRIGLWPLVLIHATIDFTKEIFERQWAHYGLVGQVLVGMYGLVALVVLLRGKQG